MTLSASPSIAAVVALTCADASPDYAANLAHFLLRESGSIWGSWSGRMSASDQRALFGRFLGKGVIAIDGARETLAHYVKVAFGQDVDCRERLHWRDL